MFVATSFEKDVELAEEDVVGIEFSVVEDTEPDKKDVEGISESFEVRFSIEGVEKVTTSDVEETVPAVEDVKGVATSDVV